MFLSKRGRIYYLFFFDENGSRHKVSTGCRRKSDALRFLQKYRQQARTKSKLLSVFFEEFLDYSATVHRPKTQESFRTAFRQFLRLVGDRPLTRVGVRDIERFIGFKAKEASPQSSRVYFVTLASAFETAKRWQYIPMNPFRHTKAPAPPKYPPEVLSQSGFLHLLTFVKNPVLRGLFVCAVCTGLRLSELINLRWENVNAESGMIFIRNSEYFKTKTGCNRAIPMKDTLRSVLLQMAGEATSGLVFHINGRKLRKEYVSKGFKRSIRLAGLDERLHFHCLRHTFASWLASESVSLYEIQKLLGHSTAAMTQIYAHLQPEQLHGTVNRIRLELR